jgi:L-rhamnose-H+ transport protein
MANELAPGSALGANAMESSAIIGLALTLLSGTMMTCAIVPMKFARRWKWENIWILYIGFGQVVFPLLLIRLTAPNAWAVLASAKPSALAAAALFGFGWGVGNVLSGIGYTMLGVGLGLTIILGLTASLGSLIPLAVLYPERLASPAAVALYFGVLVMLGGLILCLHAGNLRQANRAPMETSGGADLQSFAKGDLRTGVIICIASGILSSMLNLAFIFGDNIRTTALRLGVSDISAVNILWLPIFLFGFVPTLVYCIYLFVRNASWRAFAQPATGSNWLIGMLMGLLFVTGLSFYGIGSLRLGTRGPVLGFPVYTSAMVLSANALGFLTGEWRGSPRAAYIYELLGILLLIGSIVVIAAGNRRIA